MYRLKYFLIIIAIILSSFPALATNYHVDETGGAANWAACSGADPGNGSRCSLSQANSSADDNDVVYMYDDGGDFTSTNLQPTRSGTDNSNRIIFIAASGETPTIDGGGSRYPIYLYGKSYITIDGIDAKDPNGNYNVYINHRTQSHTYGITIQNGAYDDGGIRAQKTSNLIIKDNTLTNLPWAGILVYGTGCSQTRVEGNTLSGQFVNTDAITLHQDDQFNPDSNNGAYHIVKNNTVTFTGGSGSENCLDLVSGSYIVADGNVCTGSIAEPGILVGNSLETSWVRLVNNKVYSTYRTVADFHYDFHDTTYFQMFKNLSYGRGYFALETSGGADTARIAHNTFDTTHLYQSGAKLLNDGYDLKLKNNIFYINSGDPEHTDYAIQWGDPTDANNLSDYNLFYDENGSSSSNIYNETYDSLSEIQANYGTKEDNSIEGDPLFIDSASGDYRITTNSPAYNTAGWLTTITSATESTSTPTVDDPFWFYDGWGITGETGDTLYTAGGQSATITSIDYDTGVITLSGAINVVNGEGVTMISLDPDIGYYEVEGQSSPVISISTTDSSGAEEGTDPITFTISCSPDCAGENINYAFSGGAVLNTDYNCDDEDGVLPITGASDTIICTPVDDSDPEITETVTVTINSGTGYTVGSPDQASGTITDNDGAQDQGIDAGAILGAGSGQVDFIKSEDCSGCGSWSQ